MDARLHAPSPVAPQPVSMTDGEPATASSPGRAGTRGVPLLLDRAAAVGWRLLIVVAAGAVVVAALVQLRLIVLPLVGAFFLATLLMPLANRFRRVGLRPALAAATSMLAAALVLAGAAGFIVGGFLGEVDTLADDAAAAADEIKDWLVNGPLDLDPQQVDDTRDRIADSLEENSDALTQGAVRAGTVAIEIVVGAVLAMVVLFFILKDGQRAGTALESAVGTARADDLRALGAKLWSTMAGYLRGVAITGVVDAAIIGLGLALLGVPLVVPLMLLVFLGAFIPLVGATAAGVVAAMVALVGNGPATALAVGVLVLVVNQVEGDVLAPLVLSRAVRLHAVTILLALAAGGVLAGIIGTFLAVPVAAAVKTVMDHYRPTATGAGGNPASLPTDL